jgi:hypothetical protein
MQRAGQRERSDAPGVIAGDSMRERVREFGHMPKSTHTLPDRKHRPLAVGCMLGLMGSLRQAAAGEET